MKLGIAGAGKIVAEFLSFKEEVKGLEVCAIYARDNREGRLDRICREHKIGQQYTEYEEMLQNSGIDAVYVAVMNDAHYDFCRRALAAGKHVICEKPFTVNLRQFDDLCQLAAGQGLLLLEAITVRYLPFYDKIEADLALLGRIKIVECNYSQYSSRYDAFRNGQILPAFDVRRAGGALMDLNIYNIHFVTGLFGEPKAVHYYANIEQGIDVSGVLVLEYPSFQAVCIGAKDCKAPVTSNIQGDRGCIHIEEPVNECSAFQYILNKREPEWKTFVTGHHRMYAEFVRMTEIIDRREGEEASRRLAQSRIAMKVLDAARKSAGIVFPDDE